MKIEWCLIEWNDTDIFGRVKAFSSRGKMLEYIKSGYDDDVYNAFLDGGNYFTDSRSFHLEANEAEFVK